VQQRLVGLRLEGKAIPRAGYPVFRQGAEAKGEPIGRVSSGGWSPTLGAGIALAMVPRQEAAVGTRLEVEIRGQRHAASVCRRPFYRAKPQN